MIDNNMFVVVPDVSLRLGAPADLGIEEAKSGVIRGPSRRAF